MDKKSSAHYQREFRRRLREQGLIKKEVWIRPEFARQLMVVEKLLRIPDASAWNSLGDIMVDTANKTDALWTTETLYSALLSENIFTEGAATAELIDGVAPSMHVVMKDFGDLPVFLTVAGEQIIVESVLWPLSDINDVAAFNDAVLRTHKYFPLSTISLDAMQDGTDYYHMFGALSSSSKISNVVFEIEVLAANVIQATEAYAEYLNPSTQHDSK